MTEAAQNDRGPELSRTCAKNPAEPSAGLIASQYQLLRIRSLRTLRISRRAKSAILPPWIGTGATSIVSVERRGARQSFERDHREPRIGGHRVPRAVLCDPGNVRAPGPVQRVRTTVNTRS